MPLLPARSEWVTLALLPVYPTLANLELRFLACDRLQSLPTVATYRATMLRFDQFLSPAGVDPFSQTADQAQLPR